MGSVKAAADAHVQDLEAMRAELNKTRIGGLFDKAFAQASADIAAEIVEELKQEKAGKRGARRLSDPSNVDERNEAYVEKAADYVRRMSGGRQRISPQDQARLKAQRHVK